MSLNLSSISYAASLYNTDAISTRISGAFKQSDVRTAAQLESSRVQLSAFGQVKSTTAQLATAAQGLSDSKGMSTLDGLTKAVQGFAGAVNSRAAAVNAASSSNSSARTAGLEMRRTLEGASGSNRDALKQIGINVAANGTVSVDSKALNSAYASNPDKVRATLDKVGKAVAQQSAQQLSAGGAVGSAMSRLTEKLASVEQLQTDNQARLDQSQRAVLDQEKRLQQVQQQVQQSFGLSGVAAYNRIFGS